ncbi:MAG TPA: orotidine-5'-phosphate decarboxylase [Tepidisphaeraceae bacterium]|jgi:orotidine-5'-phosphate decarboxylase|nr:orotidine-5'-phosphate decarboxylase [Tepidisphaeraceae bacterium]
MSELFCDRLLDAIDRTRAPICVGIDPIVESLPHSIREKFQSRDDGPETAIDAIFDFTTRVLKIVAPHVPIVKFQSAYFEKYLWEGVEAYYSLIQEAKDLGLLVIGDVKRGDIGSTASAYAAGHLAEQTGGSADEIATPDAITVNPMLGLDTLEPFIKTAREFSRGLFVLVRTSNPGSAELQDAPLATGQTWSEMLAGKLSALAADSALIGTRGWSSLGAVVGATQPHTIMSLRRLLPKSIFLIPGYGAQGATGDMTRAAFINGRGAIVSASRSILYAHKEPKYSSQFGNSWEKCLEAAVVDMKRDIAQVVGSV